MAVVRRVVRLLRFCGAQAFFGLFDFSVEVVHILFEDTIEITLCLVPFTITLRCGVGSLEFPGDIHELYPELAEFGHACGVLLIILFHALGQLMIAGHQHLEFPVLRVQCSALFVMLDLQFTNEIADLHYFFFLGTDLLGVLSRCIDLIGQQCLQLGVPFALLVGAGFGFCPGIDGSVQLLVPFGNLTLQRLELQFAVLQFTAQVIERFCPGLCAGSSSCVVL